MKHIARYLAVISLFALPLAASAQSTDTITALEAQTQALLAKVAELQAKLNASAGIPNTTTGTAAATNVSATGAGVGAYGASGGAVDSSTCPNIGRVLKRGSSGDDVRRLQQFLAQDATIYPEALVTGFYGELTEAAVRRWQAKYQVVSSGTPETTGYGVVGPRTAAAIALLCSTRGPGGGSTAPVVGGYIQLTPIAGTAPLAVTITATVNTAGSCAGATYALDFGDRTQVQYIPVSTGNCNQVVQTFQHTYQYGGVYQIVLSAGSHRTTATVQVSGPTQPTTPTTPTNIFSASPTSGNSPLSVVFSSWIPAQSSPGSYQINFGDGAVAQPPFCSQTTTCQAPSQTAHTYTFGGSYRAVLVNSVSGIMGEAIISVASSTPAPTYNYGLISIEPLGSASSGAGVTVTFVVPPCAPYQLTWGDGTPISTLTASCTANDTLGVVFDASHTYTTAGNYTVGVRDGVGNLKASAGVSISL